MNLVLKMLSFQGCLLRHLAVGSLMMSQEFQRESNYGGREAPDGGGGILHIKPLNPITGNLNSLVKVRERTLDLMANRHGYADIVIAATAHLVLDAEIA